ncbi:MAG: tRNA (N6-isopentenyl adenosine(37)-C2)-methylthiotransferase MiaB [Deltaproteobacteria bacterium]|nr:tRNA (N6-isopentenyl adenosine(37)-C2)-methylthiotransferase MiaB [Deltaproteobacteria bacterium]
MKVYIKTFGCQMNEQDSAQMFALLDGQGYERVDEACLADLILFNTCSVREKAAQKIFSELGRVRLLKADNPSVIIGVAGCVAEQEKERLLVRFPFIDLIFGPDHIRHLVNLIEAVKNNRSCKDKQVVQKTGFDLRKDFEFLNVLPAENESPAKAFVTIQKGCDNICSFCIVPFVRGREVSRPHQAIIDEINALVERGVKEVTLLGQNVNSYGLKNPGSVSFAGLLELIAQKTKLKRLRFTTSHPKDVKDDLIDQYVVNPILLPQMHLPVQSGSDRILKLMRRQYTAGDYRSLVENLRRKVPHISFSTDLIVGFPTETDDDYAATLRLMDAVRFDQTFSFVYSPRPYTRAAELEDDVPQEVKALRLKQLLERDTQITRENNQAMLGRIYDVLVEKIDKENEGHPFTGRTPSNRIVHFAGACQAGDIVSVKIVKANPHSLFGEQNAA